MHRQVPGFAMIYGQATHAIPHLQAFPSWKYEVVSIMGMRKKNSNIVIG
jgi:hypothetical protein